MMLEHPCEIRPAFASHNVRSLANVMATADAFGLPRDAYELQMLHGMGGPIKAAVRRLGLRLREYAPVGELIPGMAYFVRRLLENTANESFLRLTFAEGEAVERLISTPRPSADIDGEPQRLPKTAPTDPESPGLFANQPHADFSCEENRAAFAAALARVRTGGATAGLGRHWPLWIGGEAVDCPETLTSIDPAMTTRVVGTVAYAGRAEAERALAASREAFEAWSVVPARDRAAVLFRAAELMREELFELAALEVYEAGKTWREADADVGEAIDFLEYYGREMIRLDEESSPEPADDRPWLRPLRPRGVALVVAPWNFPLAILTGMSSAALVTGNAVIVKPAGPTPVIAAQLARLLHEAGAPSGTINFLPSSGATVGDMLVRHPQVDMIAFTGSKDVGLHIIREAAAHPALSGEKQVVAEMGGKNAIIVDNDADLDVAVLESIVSAFHYQGQKCSAASRIIVLEGAYDEFLRRFSEAAHSIIVGSPEDPASRMGPVITADAKQSIESYIERGKSEGRLILASESPNGEESAQGFFIGPHIFADVAPDAVIAQDEIFGPVAAVIKARDLDEALAIANGTQYALTGGLISRSPAAIDRVRREFRVGNLYINRGITGALVERQAFGGFKMSGIGSKAGGPDYLVQFMKPASDETGDHAGTDAKGGPRRRPREEMPVEPEVARDDQARQRADVIIVRAAAAASIMCDLPARTRASAVARAARLVREDARELQARLLNESQASREDAVRESAEQVQLAAESLDRIARSISDIDVVRRMGHQPGELNHYLYKPRGLVLVLASSQRPLTSICTMAGAALAAGNAVVIKPGSRARDSGSRLVSLLASLGLPADGVSLLLADGTDLGDYFVGHPSVDMITVSGSRDVTQRVVAVAGRQPAGDTVKRVVVDVGPSGLARPDLYHILQFLEPHVITENTMRRGFAPSDEMLETPRRRG
jgi:predicted delta-1-pyrroline-5-carboxylate dehydrogenase group 2